MLLGLEKTGAVFGSPKVLDIQRFQDSEGAPHFIVVNRDVTASFSGTVNVPALADGALADCLTGARTEVHGGAFGLTLAPGEGKVLRAEE